MNNIKIVLLYSSPKVSSKAKLEKITDVICIEKGSKIVLDFNLDFNTPEGEYFVKALRVEDLGLRSNIS